MFMSSLTSSGVPLPDVVLRGLVETGLWTTSQSLGYLRGLPRAVERAHGIAAIADFLSASEAESMAGLDAELWARERVDFVVALAPRLSSSQARTLATAALDAAVEAAEEQVFAYADGLLARFLDREEKEGGDSLSGIGEIGDQSMRARVILQAHEGRRVGSQAALSQARALTVPAIRGRVLGEIGIEAGDADAVSEALVVAAAVMETATRAETFAALSRKGASIPADQVERLSAGSGEEAAPEASRRLIALLQLVDPSQRPQVLSEATDAIHQVSDPPTRAALLAALAAELPTSSHKDLLLEALSLSRRIDDEPERMTSIAALVTECRELPDVVIETAIKALDPADPADAPVYLARLLARASKRPPLVFRSCFESLVTAAPEIRARGFGDFASLLTPDMAVAAWRTLLADPRTTVNRTTLDRIAADHAGLLHARWKEVRRLPYGGEALAMLIPHLPEQDLAAVASQVEQLPEPSESALCFGTIAARAEASEQGLVERALDHCRAVLSPATRRRVMLEIASNLSGVARDKVVAALVADFRRSARDSDRHGTISALSDSGFRTQTSYVADLAQKIGDPVLRPAALAIAGEIEAAEAGAAGLVSDTARAMVCARIASGTEAFEQRKSAAAALIALDDSVAGLLIAQNSAALGAEHLSAVVDRAARIHDGYNRRLALSALCQRIGEVDGDAFAVIWPRLLRVLASRRRPELLRDLRAVVSSLAFDDEALSASVKAIEDVGRELP